MISTNVALLKRWYYVPTGLSHTTIGQHREAATYPQLYCERQDFASTLLFKRMLFLLLVSFIISYFSLVRQLIKLRHAAQKDPHGRPWSSVLRAYCIHFTATDQRHIFKFTLR